MQNIIYNIFINNYTYYVLERDCTNIYYIIISVFINEHISNICYGIHQYGQACRIPPKCVTIGLVTHYRMLEGTCV